MKILNKLNKILFIIICFGYTLFLAEASNIKPEVLEKAKKSIVTIETRVSVSAYMDLGNWSGTGFMADKKNGLIVTNAHVVGRGSIGSYFITFDTGQQTEAKLAYYDVWHDQAILKVNPEDIPDSITEIKFNSEEPSLNQSVFIIGNNEGKEFSIHTGTISSIYEINGDMPQHSYVVNLNTTGGSSGSPLMNTKGEAIGLNYGGGGTFALALKGHYVKNIVEALNNNKPINRKHIGVICKLYSLDKAVKHRNFPEDLMNQYIKNFPDTRNKALTVDSVISSSPASNHLQSGDIIWAINGKEVGANLYLFDKAMDSSEKEITLTLYRDGKKIEETIPLYNIEDNKIQKMLHFGGATFFNADDYMSAKSGIKMGSLSIVNVQTGSSFSSIPLSFSQNNREFYRLSIKRIAGHDVSNLDNLITALPNIITQKFITTEFENHQPFFQPFAGSLISSHSNLSNDITLDSIDTKPRILNYDSKKMEWIADDLN